jgi:ketosteroid isomerase-like protein
MQNEERAVAKANESFYRAFESLDIKQMEKVWARDRQIQCGHPGWRILRGWAAVMESWRRIFENTPAIRFSLADVSIEIYEGLAWVTLYENIQSTIGNETVGATVLTTNIFEKHPEGWRMIHHHGSSVAQQPAEGEPPTVH